MSNPERRAARRYHADLPAQLKFRSDRVDVRTTSVARHGVFVTTEAAFSPGDILQLSMELPHDVARPSTFVRGMVTVARSGVATQTKVDTGGPHRGLGLKFFMMNAADKELWDAYIQHLENKDGKKEGESRAERPDNIFAPKRSSDKKGLLRKKEYLGGGHAPVRFIVRPRNLGELTSFGEVEIKRGWMFLKTPLPREIYEGISLILIHPETEEELPIPGRVVRRRSGGPVTERGMEIALSVGPDFKDAFDYFVEHGERADTPSRSLGRAFMSL